MKLNNDDYNCSTTVTYNIMYCRPIARLKHLYRQLTPLLFHELYSQQYPVQLAYSIMYMCCKNRPEVNVSCKVCVERYVSLYTLAPLP